MFPTNPTESITYYTGIGHSISIAKLCLAVDITDYRLLGAIAPITV